MPNQDQSNPIRDIERAHSENNPTLRPLENQPRQPRYLAELLRFATEAAQRNGDSASSGTGSGSARRPPMDPERSRFLENALCNLQMGTTAEVSGCIKILSDKEVISNLHCDSVVPDIIMEAFDVLSEALLNLDMPIGFYNMGGYKVFYVCLSCEHIDVRSEACQLLADVCQNNAVCQAHALESGFLNSVLSMFEGEEDEELFKPALSAVSSMVRDCHPAAQVFFAGNGCKVLVECIKNFDPRLREKASFLTSYLYPQYPEMKEKTADFIEALAEALHSVETGEKPEQLIQAVHVIVSESNRAVLSECAKPDSKLQKSLEKCLGHLENDPRECEEEIENCKVILNMMSKLKNEPCTSASDENIDR